jgi:signal transduction histidine kinase
LTNSLLALANYEEGNGTHFEPVDLQLVAADALKTITPIAKNKKITIKKDLSAVTIFGDKGSLTELLVILLDNAVKYSQTGTEINLAVSQNDSSAQIIVQDNGIGMEDNEKEHIFDRFYRTEASRGKSGPQGYGIGLSLAKKIVDLHQGNIQVQTKKGEGSTFTINLPLKRKTRFSL